MRRVAAALLPDPTTLYILGSLDPRTKGEPAIGKKKRPILGRDRPLEGVGSLSGAIALLGASTDGTTSRDVRSGARHGEGGSCREDGRTRGTQSRPQFHASQHAQQARSWMPSTTIAGCPWRRRLAGKVGPRLHDPALTVLSLAGHPSPSPTPNDPIESLAHISLPSLTTPRRCTLPGPPRHSAAVDILPSAPLLARRLTSHPQLSADIYLRRAAVSTAHPPSSAPHYTGQRSVDPSLVHGYLQSCHAVAHCDHPATSRNPLIPILLLAGGPPDCASHRTGKPAVCPSRQQASRADSFPLAYLPTKSISSLAGLSQARTVTISTPIRIQSILSPPDPPDTDDTQTNSSYQSAPKRRYDDPSGHPDASLIPPTPPAPPDRRLSTATDLSQGSGVGGVPRGYVDHEMKPVLAGLTFESKKQNKMRPPMRSSIACLRCRKSKIKCENNGGTSPCDSCLKTGKDCVFKLPEANPTPPKRNEPPSAIKQERDGGSDRKKLKKIDELSKLDGEKATLFADEVLSAPFLTEDVWDQVLDLYKLHFAPELPFLHLPTMKEKLGRRFRNQQPESSADFNLVLLGVLTLTARYHTDLVKYLAHICNAQGGNARSRPVQTQVDPAAASEYYAETLTRALGSVRNAMGSASVERVQALLMLGLYEWGQTRPNTGGLGAWMFVGTAIRMAQFLQLGFLDRDFRAIGEKLHDKKKSGSQSQETLEKEIKRRTMFSCFVLDRMLSCGKERQAILHPSRLSIQLPCSEDKFDLAMNASTGFLDPRDDDPMVSDDSVLSRFIQLVHLWGDISRYSVDGGRLIETLPPWDRESSFFKLRTRLLTFEEELPATFTFSRSNYFKHENHQASSVYVLMHMLRNVCLIMLHREYIPFVPIRCSEPEGPIDDPIPPKDQNPPGFWLDSAEQVFKGAREIIDLIEICQKKDKLPQSTIVLFAIWTAAFVSLYAIHFEQMDTQQHILSYKWNEPAENEQVDIFRHGPLGLANTTLNKMSICLSMATTYVTVLQKMDVYFVRIKQDYHNHVKENKGLSEKTSLSLRLGGRGGGLEEYKNLPMLKEFGYLQPHDHSSMDHPDQSRASTMDRMSPITSDNHLPPIDRGGPPRSMPSGSFTAINHAGPYGLNGSAGHRPEDAHTDNWNRPSNLIRQAQSPSQAIASSTLAMLNSSTAVAQSSPSDDEYSLFDQERKRFANTNDLTILTQNNDPWMDAQQFPFFDLPNDLYT
ncbi:hypothetical protein JX265_012995 [Neoarthrinium moseri]|uniref:Zn(2)-C6 fungal-type domain-containing protein n=1 Tax=Neoarthrinium moseri TaxID=1658444 RepID=A0A9P9W9G5_9PEZI|nr:hypothetical protein JX265_012995 [Neoarthrinium moseri]